MINKTIVLVLSGRIKRGAIPVGVVNAFNLLLARKRYKIRNAIFGISVVTIIGRLYNSGIYATELKEIIASQTIGKMRHFTHKNCSLANIKGLRKILNSHINNNNYTSLEKQLYVCVSNIKKRLLRDFFRKRFYYSCLSILIASNIISTYFLTTINFI